MTDLHVTPEGPKESSCWDPSGGYEIHISTDLDSNLGANLPSHSCVNKCRIERTALIGAPRAATYNRATVCGRTEPVAVSTNNPSADGEPLEDAVGP